MKRENSGRKSTNTSRGKSTSDRFGSDRPKNTPSTRKFNQDTKKAKYPGSSERKFSSSAKKSDTDFFTGNKTGNASNNTRFKKPYASRSSASTDDISGFKPKFGRDKSSPNRRGESMPLKDNFKNRDERGGNPKTYRAKPSPGLKRKDNSLDGKDDGSVRNQYKSRGGEFSSPVRKRKEFDKFDAKREDGPVKNKFTRSANERNSSVSKKKAYGGSATYKERKEINSLKEIQEENIENKGKWGDRKSESPRSLPGKGKFTKKSELKGYKPKFRKTENQTDFRFLKPGSRGKDLKLGEETEFVSKSKSQSKERITENALTLGESVRLNRFISNAGVCSRREADELIGAGLVSINGEVVTELGSKVNAGDVVRFNGEKLAVEAKIYILLNKPKDAITTSDDPDGRNTVMDIFEGKMRERIYPIGRLDRNTTGVLLLTNDGELAQRLMHPKYEINKVYKATLNKNLKPADLWTLSNGVELEDGFIKPDAIAQSDAKNKNIVGIEIHSGRNRIIHRMFEHLGYSVEKLDRVLYAGIEKGTLKRGEWRELNEKELKSLKRTIQLK